MTRLTLILILNFLHMGKKLSVFWDLLFIVVGACIRLYHQLISLRCLLKNRRDDLCNLLFIHDIRIILICFLNSICKLHLTSLINSHYILSKKPRFRIQLQFSWFFFKLLLFMQLMLVWFTKLLSFHYWFIHLAFILALTFD